MLEGIVLAMMHEGRRVMKDPHDYEARANIMWAGMVVHNDVMGVGRKQDWNSHHLEHVLSAVYDCAHGAGLSVIMPAWMSYCVEHSDALRFAQMATRIFGCQMDYDDPKRTAREGVEAFKNFLRELNMPGGCRGLQELPARAQHAAHLCGSRRGSRIHPPSRRNEQHRRRCHWRLCRSRPCCAL